MENKVILKFDDNIVLLAGYEYGEQIYNSQVAGKINFEEDFYIEFPKTINGVASSFVQGFFAQAKKAVGLDNIVSRSHITSKDESLSKKIISKLY